MFDIILIIILAVIAVVAIGIGLVRKAVVAWLVGLAAIVIGAGVLFFSSFYTQGVGEAKVIVNFDGTVAGENLDPGAGWKAPNQGVVDFDLFSQEVLYAGKGDAAPSYSGGTVSGSEVTANVGGVNGGSTQAFVDISVVYSLDPEAVTSIYNKYKSQERFTKQVVEKTILSTIREIPAQYTAIEFRGEKRGEASDKMAEAILSKLAERGIEDVQVNIQDIRFSESVESALTDVENANQAVQKAEALQRQKLVDAETKRIEAQGEADAIAIRNSQAPNAQVLEQLRIEALKAAADNGSLVVVPDGSQPLINTGK